MKAGWQIAPLGELTQFINGLWKGEEPPFVHVGVIRNTNFTKEGDLDDSDIAYLDVEAKKFAKRRLQFGDLILEKSGGGPKQPVGRVVLFDKTEGDFSFSNFTAAIRISDPSALDARFLHKYLYWVYVSGRTEVMQSHSTGIRNLNGDAYKAIKVGYPSLAEQHRIVAILDEAFEGIAIAKANAEKNLQNARELFGRLSAAVLNQLAPISRTTTLEEVAESGCSLSYGIVQPGDEVAGGLPIVRPVDLNDGVVMLDGLKRIDPALAKSYERTTLKGNDILLCVRGTTGALAMADSELAGANVTRGIVPIRFDEAQISQDFGYCLMRSEPVQMQIQAKTYGTALMQINIRDLRQLTLPVPPKQEQDMAVKRFIELKAATDQLVETYQRKLTALDELKKSLLHQAFSGQL